MFLPVGWTLLHQHMLPLAFLCLRNCWELCQHVTDFREHWQYWTQRTCGKSGMNYIGAWSTCFQCDTIMKNYKWISGSTRLLFFAWLKWLDRQTCDTDYSTVLMQQVGGSQRSTINPINYYSWITEPFQMSMYIDLTNGRLHCQPWIN